MMKLLQFGLTVDNGAVRGALSTSLRLFTESENWYSRMCKKESKGLPVAHAGILVVKRDR